MEHPTNKDLQDLFTAHAKEDAVVFKAIHEKLDSVPTKEDVAEIVGAVITDFFKTKGKFTFQMIVGTSILIGALVVIFGGLKTVLGWIGFSQISK
jgi:hypothetical protein